MTRRSVAAGFLGPGAARAVEAVALIDLAQRLRGAERPHLCHGALHADQHGLDPGGFVFRAGDLNVVFVVGRVDVVAVPDGGHRSNVILTSGDLVR